MIYNLLTILGPTASGKTSLAAHVASKLGSGVISADSRQVYQGMDIGTGKDFDDYIIDGKPIPLHLVNICKAGEKYNLFEYQKDFNKVFHQFSIQNKIPVLCGGSGLYIEAVLKGYDLSSVPVNQTLRNELGKKSDEELVKLLASYKKLHNTTDTATHKRLIRAIEIEIYQKENSINQIHDHEISSLIAGIKFERSEQKKRITDRLKFRLENGMIEEVELLLENGISPENLIYYGLEYKFITQYLIGEIEYDEMFNLLNIAIHQFSKRQMTWFRKMERSGFQIHWLNGNLPLEEKVEKVLKLMKA
jgi:tRNA dimethylallyltransferase